MICVCVNVCTIYEHPLSRITRFRSAQVYIRHEQPGMNHKFRVLSYNKLCMYFVDHGVCVCVYELFAFYAEIDLFSRVLGSRMKAMSMLIT